MKIKLSALVITGLLLLSGCAGSAETTDQESAAKLTPLAEVTPLKDPTAYTGPTTVQLPEVALEPYIKSPDPQLPVTVTSYALTGEKEVTVSNLERIVPLSLGGSVADYVYSYGFGNKIVGRDVSTEIPELKDVPVVTRDGHSVDAETVLSLDPTLVITDGTIGPTDVIEQFADAGVAVVYVEKADTYEASFKQAEQIAAALGVSEHAAGLVEQLREDISAKEAEIAQWLKDAGVATRPRAAFLYMRGEGVFYLFGEGSGIDTLFASLEVGDVAKEIAWVGQRPMNDEALVNANPDTLLVMTKGLASVGGVSGMLEVHPATALTTAGKNQRVIDIADTGLFVGAPRVPYVLDALARAFYAPDSLEASEK